MRLLALAAWLVLAATVAAHADEDERALAKQSIVFARGGALVKTDALGKNPVELAPLPSSATIRTLRTDPGGVLLLVDLGGSWAYLPLDGRTKQLAPLPCADGPAQLAPDASAILCRPGKDPNLSLVVQLATGKATPVAIPTAGARIVGTGTDRKLVWAEATGVWTAPLGDLRKKTRVAPDAPLRGFLSGPDGKRAVAVYAETTIEAGGRRAARKSGEMLVGFALDGVGAHRKGMRDGIALSWSHDAVYVLVQDGSSACLVRADGGEFKCWPGFLATSLAPDASYALVLGIPAKTALGDGRDDVPVAPPAGPHALYRAQLGGSAYVEPPHLIARDVDGAAVWLP